jgi:hypothetical protein
MVDADADAAALAPGAVGAAVVAENRVLDEVP